MWCSEILPASRRRNADYFIGSRVAKDEPSRTWQQLKTRGKRLIVDFDDDYFHIDETNKAAHIYWNKELQNSLIRNIAISDVVTVVSETLAKVMREYHDNVKVVPNGLHASLLSAPRPNNPNVRIGWAGTTSTLPELGLAARALNKALDLNTPQGKPSLHIVGTSLEGAASQGVKHDRIQAVEWIEGHNRYLRACRFFDIWVAPYRDIPYNHAKFATKALEAGFLGIPLIASDITPYAEWIQHGKTGFIVRQPHEWGHYLKLLLENPDLRVQIGLQARAYASKYSLQGLGSQWEEAIQ